jgi:hypothetical protein
MEKMHAFISGLSVDVLSLFETKPRQSLKAAKPLISDDESYVKAFRLCINSDHCERLLVDSKWPAYISISEWFFKSTSQSKPSQDINSASISGAVDEGVAIIDSKIISVVGDVKIVDDDNDDTIVMDDHSQGPSGQKASSLT